MFTPYNEPIKRMLYVLFIVTISIFFFAGCSEKNTGEVQNKVETTSIYDDCFDALSGEIGRMTFVECEDYVQSKGYSASITQPDDNTIGKINIVDQNGFYAELWTYPNKSGVEILTMVIYSSSDDCYQGCISDGLHTSSLEYTTYDIDRERRNMVVSSIGEITEFIFSVAPEKIEEYQDNYENAVDIDVYMELCCDYNGGYPLFSLSTNLPDETDILLTFSDGSSVAQEHISIEDNSGESSQFSLDGKQIGKGRYTLGVSMAVPLMQSSSVRAVIGNNGEHLSGELITGSDTRGKYVDVDYEIEIESDGTINISDPVTD